MKRFKSIILLVIIVFIAINVLSIANLVSDMALGRPNSAAKCYCYAAAHINFLYVIPISRILGFDSILTIPFRSLRDYLYNKGTYMLPQRDAERHMWWYMIKYMEFERTVSVPIRDYYNTGVTKYDPSVFEDWTNDIYYNLEPLATLPLKDYYLKSKRFNIFVVVARAYLMKRATIVARKNGSDDITFFLKDNKEIEKVIKIFNWFKILKSYAEIHEKQGLDHFYNKTWNWYGDLLLFNRASLCIVYNNIYNNTFVCNNEYLHIYINTSEKLNDILQKNQRIYPKDRPIIISEIQSPMDKELISIVTNKYGCKISYN